MKTLLFLHLLSIHVVFASSPTAVETFNSMGLYWETSGGADVTCKVEYRNTESNQWRPALDLWWAGSEYRGSVLDLKAGTEYEFRLKKGGELATLSKSTWSDAFEITSEKQMSRAQVSVAILEGGSEERGYVVYDFENAIVDADNEGMHCLTIDADYVIVRNGAFINAVDSAIVVEENRHHVVIEGVVVENWGHKVAGYDVSDRIGGITLREGCSQVVIQGCKIG
ncbi:MAG: fibronectin type III domain-containing protein, partial [Opitutales bacterium]|nr:fibronectin type III domain-containing protein [Opitutales bacterium]